MKRWLLVVAASLFAAACTNTTTAGASPNLIGTHDLVFVDQLGDGGLVSRLDVVPNEVDGGVAYVLTGMPARYLYVTSADTNELRVFETFRQLSTGSFDPSGFVAAPNPLEALSIPVLQRPTILVTDEGRNEKGARVTGQYVYAARPGASELSVVSVAARRQIGGGPLPLPGPLTAVAAAMNVGVDQRLPDTTTLFVATWDGAAASVYRATLETAPAALDEKLKKGQVAFTRIGLVQGESFAAMLAIAPLATRTLDGAPFCATSWCLALSTRPAANRAGQSLLLDPATGRSVPLGFSAGVRKLAAGATTGRLYGVLDEAGCGSAECGGVVAVDLVAATSSAGFPAAKNFVGEAFGPLRLNGSIINGLSIAQGASVAQAYETNEDGGSTLNYKNLQAYDELGAFSGSDGRITFFSGVAGSVIDFDGRRSTVTAASVRTPGTLPDGGESFANVDGGSLGALASATVTPDVTSYPEVYRVTTITTPEPQADWRVEVSDGYFVTQELVVASRGPVPGLVSLATSAADGTRLATGGFETRALVGDVIVFESGDATAGYVECGRATITAVNSGTVDIDQVPDTCAARSRFSVRAGPTPKPLVVVGGSEGYMGRAAPGETFTYNRPFLMIPAGVVSNRTSLTLTIPAMVPAGEGAYVTFGLQGHMTPLAVTIDPATTSLTSCASTLSGQVVFGNVAMGLVPRNVSGQPSFRWKVFSVVPSGNALSEIDLAYTRAGGTALTGNDLAVCYR